MLTLNDITGREFVVELGASELRNMLSDALRLVSADPGEVSRWRRALSADDRRPGTCAPAVADVASTTATAAVR